jgi:hypothetical protein
MIQKYGSYWEQHESCMRTIKNYQIRNIDGIDLRNMKREHMESMGISLKKTCDKAYGIKLMKTWRINWEHN